MCHPRRPRPEVLSQKGWPGFLPLPLTTDCAVKGKNMIYVFKLELPQRQTGTNVGYFSRLL